MKKKNKKEFNFEVAGINVFLCLLVVCLLIILIYYFLVYRNDSNEKLWDVHFSRVINKECSYEAVCTTPTIYTDSTSTGDYTVEFSQANQKAIYEIEVTNNGLVDAEITDIVLGNPHCKGNSSNPEKAYNDSLLVCEKVKYSLLDEDSNKVVPGNILKVGERKTYQLILTYDDNNYFISEDERLSDTVTVRNLNLTINYNQVR